MADELVKTESELVLEGDPKAQLEFGKQVADALMERISSKKKTVKINGQTYLEYGDWQVIARFYGATVGSQDCQRIERDGQFVGYEAKAMVYRQGEIISSAEASCFKDEPNWKSKPEFQLKSMAQTRASAKALRNAFGWVAEMAGYASTPAEEMNSGSEIGFDKPIRTATDKQIEWMRGTARRKMRNLADDDETDNAIQNIIGMKPQEVPIGAVKEKVDMINATETDEETMPNEPKETDMEGVPY